MELCLAASNPIHVSTSTEDKKVNPVSQSTTNAVTSPSPTKAVSSPSGTPSKINQVKGTNLSTPSRQSRNERRPLAERMRPTSFEDIMVWFSILVIL